MLSRRLFVPVTIIAFCSTASFGQQKSEPGSSRALREFPIVLQQSVEAGKTPVGTEVKGRLAVATLFHGIAIPRNAVITGVVFASVAKTANAPSRLGIRMENAKWKGESTCMMKAYLMPLYYAMSHQSVQGPPDASPDPDSRTLNGPNQSGSSPMSSPSFSGGNSEAMQVTIPDIPTISSRPVSMKDVAMEPIDNGGIELVSQHGNIKLNKMTTYVLAALEAPAK